MCLALSIHIDRIASNHGTTGHVSFPNVALQTMLRPVVVSQSTGGLPRVDNCLTEGLRPSDSPAGGRCRSFAPCV